jgi:predicted MFS family arabinose efflux permease
LFASNSRIWIAFAAQISITCLSSFITPAFGAALPNLTRSDDELRQANALFGSSWGAMVFIGAAAGGFFSQAFGRTATFTADIATFLVCAGLVSLIKTPMQQQRTTEHRSRMRPFADMKEAIHYAKSDHTILALLSSKTMFAFGAGTVSQLSVLAIDVFNKGDGGSGMLLAARGFGASIGPFLIMRFVRNNMPRLLKVCGTAGIAYAVLYVATAASPNIWIACLCVMGAHLGGGAQWTLSTYGLQVRVPDHILGRVLAGDMALAILVMGTSSFAAGILGELLPIRLAIAVIGATSGITAVVFLLATMGIRRRLRSEMQQQSDSTRAYL